MDGNWFKAGFGGSHNFKYGIGWRRTDAFSQTIWPGDKIQGRIESATSSVARLYREGAGTDRTEYFSLYVGDTFSLDRLTLDLGLRYDRQGGKALPSATEGNGAKFQKAVAELAAKKDAEAEPKESEARKSKIDSLKLPDGVFRAELAEWAGEKFKATNQSQADAIVTALNGAAYVVRCPAM